MKQLEDSPVEEVKENKLDIEGIPPFSFFQKERGVVITFGVFDSVQQGQQAIIRQVIKRAREYGVLAVVLVFRPRPIETLHPGRQAYFTAQDETVRIIKELGVDHVGVLKFTKELAETRAGEFLSQLVERLPVRELWVGIDALVGKGSEGQFSSVCKIGQHLGFKVEGFPSTASVSRKEPLFKLFDEKDIAGVRQNLGRKYTLPAYITQPSRLADLEGVSQFKVLTPDWLFVPPDGDYVVSLQPAKFEEVGPQSHVGEGQGILSITTSRLLYMKHRLSLIASINAGWAESFVSIAFDKALTFSPMQLWQRAFSEVAEQGTEVEGYRAMTTLSPAAETSPEREEILDRFLKNGHMVSAQV